MKLVYRPKKWDKQLQVDKQIWKELGGFVSLKNLKSAIKKEQLKIPKERNYQSFFSCCSLYCNSIASAYYLCDTEDLRSLYYTYLSGKSAILERQFASLYVKKGREIFEAKRGMEVFDYHILQMIAIGQPLPKCVQQIDNIYIQLLNKDIDSVDKYIQSRKDKIDSGNFWGNDVSEDECMDIEMILKGDKVSLRNGLMQGIKEDRKEPIDYFNIIDIYSTAMIKLARKYGMDIDIDVIEIPKLFFDEKCCNIDKSKIEVPFYEEALAVLKENGILWDE